LLGASVAIDQGRTRYGTSMKVRHEGAKEEP
jgi:hypothetical protein